MGGRTPRSTLTDTLFPYTTLCRCVCKDVPDPDVAGFGHAFGFPIKRLFGRRAIPVVPLMLNTYFPPNVLSSRRCFDIGRSEEHTSELQSLMRTSYAVFCLKKNIIHHHSRRRTQPVQLSPP